MLSFGIESELIPLEGMANEKLGLELGLRPVVAPLVLLAPE